MPSFTTPHSSAPPKAILIYYFMSQINCSLLPHPFLPANQNQNDSSRQKSPDVNEKWELGYCWRIIFSRLDLELHFPLNCYQPRSDCT